MKTLKSPFKSNSYGCVNTTAEGDVVEGVEYLGEDVGIDGTVQGEWPRPNWNGKVYNLAVLNRIDVILPLTKV